MKNSSYNEIVKNIDEFTRAINRLEVIVHFMQKDIDYIRSTLRERIDSRINTLQESIDSRFKSLQESIDSRFKSLR
jgi:Cdc6-like AAA superfamily ATPase